MTGVFRDWFTPTLRRVVLLGRGPSGSFRNLLKRVREVLDDVLRYSHGENTFIQVEMQVAVNLEASCDRTQLEQCFPGGLARVRPVCLLHALVECLRAESRGQC